jgi:CHAT domain-containing protein
MARVWILLLGFCAWGQTPYDDLAARLIAAPDRLARQRILDENAASVTIELRRALIGAANALALQNDLPPAEKIYRIACEVSARANDTVGVAACSYNVGLMRARQHHEDEALPLLEDALDKYAALNDHKYQGRVLNNLSILYANRHDYERYFDIAEQALAHKRQAGEPREELNTRVGIGIAHFKLGQFDRAAQALIDALDLARKIGWDKGVADALLNLGCLYYEIGDYDLALRYARESVEIRDRLEDKRDYADALDLLGIVYARLGQLGLAREQLDRAAAEAVRGKDEEAASSVLFHQGNLLFGLKQNGPAREKLEKAAAIAGRIHREWLMRQAEVSLAEIANAESRWEDAVALAQPALEFARGALDPQLVRRASAVLAEALEKLGRPAEVEPLLRAAVDAAESVRDHIAAAPETARLYLEDKADVYYRLIDVLERQGRHEEALAISERSRARVLLQVVRSGNVHIDRALTGDERKREWALRTRIAGLREANDRAALEAATVEYRAFKNELYARHPELRVRRLDTEPIRPAELASRLPLRDTALVEYAVSAESVTMLVVTVEDGRAVTRGYTLPMTASKLAAAVRQYRESIASRDLGFRPQARALYRTLLEPAAAQLRGRKNLVIVPDAFLWELPFQALVGPRGQYLIEDAAVSYAPSLTVLAEMARQKKPGGEERILAVGAAPLAEMRREAEGLAIIYGADRTDVLLGSEADERQIRADAPQAGVIHLAAHGVFRDGNPMSSFLRVAREGRPEAGQLEARDMMQLDLTAQMVVLSGCETARGVAGAGEGLIGMSWALFVAGAPTTVASQWKVDSASTSDLMLRFHRGVRETGRKAQSMQAAALGVMKRPEFRHPFYWSGFVVIGDGF